MALPNRARPDPLAEAAHQQRRFHLRAAAALAQDGIPVEIYLASAPGLTREVRALARSMRVAAYIRAQGPYLVARIVPPELAEQRSSGPRLT